jgi:hypothetical protein
MALIKKMQTGGETTEQKVEELVTEQAGIGDTTPTLPTGTEVDPVLLEEQSNELLQ